MECQTSFGGAQPMVVQVRAKPNTDYPFYFYSASIIYPSLHTFSRDILQELDEIKVSCPARKTSFHLGMKV